MSYGAGGAPDPPARGSSSGSAWWRNWRLWLPVAAIAFGTLAWWIGSKPSSETLREMLAEQLGVDAENLFVNIPPLPSRYPGAILLDMGDWLLEGVGPDHPSLIRGGRFGFSGRFRGLTTTEGSLGSSLFKVWATSGIVSDYTISVDPGQVVEIAHLADWLQQSVLAPDLRDGAIPAKVVMRAWEGQMSVGVVRQRRISAEAWTEVVQELLDAAKETPKIEVRLNRAQNDTVTIRVIDPVVFAFEALNVSELLAAVPRQVVAAPDRGEPDPEAAVKSLIALDPFRVPDLKQTLREIGPEAGQAVIEVMFMGDRIERERGSVLFESLPPEARPEMGDPGLALGEADPAVRAWSVMELSESERPDRVGLLSSALVDENPTVRFLASESLRKLGSEAGVAESQLSRATQDADPTVSLSAEVALLGLRAAPGQGFTVAHAALRESRPEDRIAGIRFLGEARYDPDSTVAFLVLALGDSIPSVQQEALMELGRLGQSAGAAVQAIQALLERANPETRQLAEQTLLRIRRR